VELRQLHGLVRSGQTWLVHWTPALLHPKLEAGQRLQVSTNGDQPAVVDRDGKALVGGRAAGTSPAPILQDALIKVAQLGAGGDTGWSVVRVESAGKQLETLFTKEGTAAKPLTSSLSLATQASAQAAVDSASGSAMIVALQPSIGDILAVAQNAAAGNGAHGAQRPLRTRFHVQDRHSALEQGGTNVDRVLPSPGSAVIGQRTIPTTTTSIFPRSPCIRLSRIPATRRSRSWHRDCRLMR
jgi:hypothetical protein